MQITSVKLRRSQRGVPHTVYTIDGVDYSVQYFGKSQVYAVFKDYATRRNHRLFTIAVKEGDTINLLDEIKKYV